MLTGFADELVKLAGRDPSDAGLGVLAVPLPKPIGPMEPLKPPKFKEPPGLPKIKMPPKTLRRIQMPGLRPRLPKVWQRPGAQQ